MSACSKCSDPGKCCRDFPLPRIRTEDYPTALHALAAMATLDYEVAERGGRIAIGFPFVPIRTGAHEGLDDHWRFRCLNLLPDGRCGDYENRPYGPCVMYTPGEDLLCALHVPKIGVCIRDSLS